MPNLKDLQDFEAGAQMSGMQALKKRLKQKSLIEDASGSSNLDQAGQPQAPTAIKYNPDEMAEALKMMDFRQKSKEAAQAEYEKNMAAANGPSPYADMSAPSEQDNQDMQKAQLIREMLRRKAGY